MKKRILSALLSAVIGITSIGAVGVMAEESGSGTRVPFPLEEYVGQYIPEGEYGVEGAENVKYIFSFDDVGTPDAKVRDADASDGTRSLRIRATDTESTSRGLGAEFTLKFGNPTENGKYVISLDLYREQASWRDYAALNYDGWDGTARLSDENTKWTITELGEGQAIGGTGTGSWSRYTATLSTIADDPQLNIGIRKGSELHIDNIIIKDTSGNVLFAESFEADGPIIAGVQLPAEPEPTPTPTPTPEEPEEPGIDGPRYPFPLEDYVGEYIPAGAYPVEGTENVIYYIRNNGHEKSVAIVRTEDASDGTRSLRIRAQDTEPAGTTLCTEFTVEFGETIKGETYEVSFDAWREVTNWTDYAALNYDGWDGASRLTNTTKWTVTDLGVGSEIGGVGSGTWKRYTASFKTDIAPQFNVAVAGWGELHIDNIVVKDSSGKVVFADSFETDGPIIGVVVEPSEPEPTPTPTPTPEEPEEPEVTFDPSVPKHTYLHGKYYEMPFENYMSGDFTPGEYAFGDTGMWVYENNEGNGKVGRAKITTGNVVSGERSLYMYAHNGGDGALYNPGAKMTLHFGELTGDGTYTIQFDMAPWDADYRDFVALNMDGWDSSARIKFGGEGTTWTRGEEITPSKNGDNLKYYRYTGTVKTTLDPELSFAVWGYSRMVIDNIIIKDSTGTIVFSEGFEGGIPEGWVDPGEPEEPGDEEGFECPFESYVDADCIPVGDYVLEGAENVIYRVRTNGDSGSFDKLRSTDASNGTRSLRLRANDSATSGTTLCAELTIEFGEATVGEIYEVSFDASREHSDWRDYAAINYEGWDGASRLTGTTKWTVTELGVGSEIGGVGDKTWSRYTANFRTDYAPQINFAVAGWGELHIDNIVVKNSSGEVVFADSFEADGPIIGSTEAPEVHEHSYTEEVTVAPTHTTVGTKTFTCSCGDSYTEEIAKTEEHSYTGEVTVAPTHTAVGTKTYTCECGDSYTEEIAKTEEHSYTGEVTVAPTHTAVGTKTYTCECGDSYTEEIAKTPEHTYAEEITTPATCGADGVKTFACECGDSYTEVIPATGVHAWDDGVVTTPATHMAEGVMTYTCTVCGETKTEVIDKIAEHNFVTLEMLDADNHKVVCECGEYITEAHAWDEGTVTVAPEVNVPGVKTYTCKCGATYTEEIPALKSGDIDGDNEVTVKDLLPIRRFIAGGYGVDIDPSLADVYKDGLVNAKDIITIRRFIAGGYGVIL